MLPNVPNYSKAIYRPVSLHDSWRIGAPDELRVTLRYTSSQLITSTTGVPSGYLFRGNSCFDPDLTGGGNQPQYYNVLSAIWSRFRVLGSRMTCRVITANEPTVGIDYAFCAIPTTTGYSILTSIDNLKSQRYQRNGSVAPQSLADQQSCAVSTGQIFGLPEDIPNVDDVFQGSASSDPSRVWCWQFALYGTDHASTVTGLVSFMIDYDVVLFDRVLTTQ